MKPPIFILGNPRSGTSLLRLIMTCHPEICIPPECGFVIWLSRTFSDWSEACCQSEQRVLQFLDALEKARKFDTWGVDLENIRRKIILESPQDYASLCSVVYEEYSKMCNKERSRWGDKNNFHMLHVPDLDQLYPNAMFLHIVRDPRDVACSYKELVDLKSTSPYAPKLPQAADEIAKEWSDNVGTCLQAFSEIASHRTFTVKYEDLVSTPKEQISRICEWLGEEFHPDMMQFHEANKMKQLEPLLTMDWKGLTQRPVTSKRVERYKEMLSGEEIDEIETYCEGLMGIHNYVIK